jgi:hypothetical protein
LAGYHPWSARKVGAYLRRKEALTAAVGADLVHELVHLHLYIRGGGIKGGGIRGGGIRGVVAGGAERIVSLCTPSAPAAPRRTIVSSP